jgi:hypothetical protein
MARVTLVVVVGMVVVVVGMVALVALGMVLGMVLALGVGGLVLWGAGRMVGGARRLVLAGAGHAPRLWDVARPYALDVLRGVQAWRAPAWRKCAAAHNAAPAGLASDWTPELDAADVSAWCYGLVTDAADAALDGAPAIYPAPAAYPVRTVADRRRFPLALYAVPAIVAEAREVADLASLRMAPPVEYTVGAPYTPAAPLPYRKAGRGAKASVSPVDASAAPTAVGPVETPRKAPAKRWAPSRGKGPTVAELRSAVRAEVAAGRMAPVRGVHMLRRADLLSLLGAADRSPAG